MEETHETHNPVPIAGGSILRNAVTVIVIVIVIGMRYMKNLNPGPTIFIDNPVALHSVFILANLQMIPPGCPTIKLARQILLPLIMRILRRAPVSAQFAK